MVLEVCIANPLRFRLAERNNWSGVINNINTLNCEQHISTAQTTLTKKRFHKF